MKIEREILGIDVTIYFDEYGNVLDIEVDEKDIDTLQENLSDFYYKALELVNQYFESEREQAQDRDFERKRGN